MSYFCEFTTIEEILNDQQYMVALCDQYLNLVGANDIFAAMYKRTPKQLVGLNVLDIYPTFNKSIFFDCWIETRSTGNNVTKIGYSDVFNSNFHVRGFKHKNHYVLLAHRITDVQQESTLVSQCDAITGLFNRQKFEEDINGRILNGAPFSILIIDVLKLKKLNDIYGESSINSVLMKLAGKLKQAFHQEGITEVYRISPDKFALVSMLEHEGIQDIARRALDYIQNVHNQDEEIQIEVAIAINQDTTQQNQYTIVQNTENTIALAKKQKVSLLYYAPDNLKITKAEIEDAFKNNEFSLHYQPQIDCINDRVCGVEALIRWHHPKKGVLSPGVFLPSIERFDFMYKFELAVIELASKDGNQLRDVGINIPIAINLSADSLSNPLIVEHLINTKQAHRNSTQMVIEITESSIMSDVAQSKENIQKFKEHGIQIAIDDFGTGYSSFGYIIKYPTHYLKLDREFITDLDTCTTRTNIVSNIIKMAHSLGIAIIAEGAETKEEVAVLKQIHCDIIQGYYYSKPVEITDLISKIAELGLSNMKSNIF